jgi:hypothetical protein
MDVNIVMLGATSVMYIKKTSLEKDWTACLKYDDHSRFGCQCYGEGEAIWPTKECGDL